MCWCQTAATRSGSCPAAKKIDLRSPKKWWRAIGRDPARKMDIFLRKVDLHGKTLEQVTVATGVAMPRCGPVRARMSR
ncbi:hypothetical protein LP419_01645 [Massilia sp. H-1]|nr:hypothetical protein LP419_01645 [Massilia sp. H-1]